MWIAQDGLFFLSSFLCIAYIFQRTSNLRVQKKFIYFYFFGKDFFFVTTKNSIKENQIASFDGYDRYLEYWSEGEYIYSFN